MRIDVQSVRTYMVHELLQAPHVREVWHEGEDMIMLDLVTGETVCIYFLLRAWPLADLRVMLADNTARGVFTLFVCWGNLLMPTHGQAYMPDAWMRALLEMHGGRIYSYDAYLGHTVVFPVTFERSDGGVWHALHGKQANIGQLSVHSVVLQEPGLGGTYRVATFTRQHAQTSPPADLPHPARNTVRYAFNVLGLAPDATREAVKQAYRALARQYHPDLNAHADATAHMQQLNEAYARLMLHLDAPGD